MTWQVVDRSVIIPHNCHYNQNGWLKYDHRLTYKKYTTALPFYGMWGSRKTSWYDQANKKRIFILMYAADVYHTLGLTTNQTLILWSNPLPHRRRSRGDRPKNHLARDGPSSWAGTRAGPDSWLTNPSEEIEKEPSFEAQSVWQDWPNFVTFATFESIWHLFEGLFSIGQNCEHVWQLFMLLGKLSFLLLKFMLLFTSNILFLII